MATTSTDEWMSSITADEAAQIWTQLHVSCPLNRQVLWSGVSYHYAQEWADRRGLQTMSIAMGRLLNKKYQGCRLNIRTSSRQRKVYFHAASIIFAIYISTGTCVTLLTPPPPERFHPSDPSYYQRVEEPWIKKCCDSAKFQIQMVHPSVREAESYAYQYWPEDCKSDWEDAFAGVDYRPKKWQSASSNGMHRSIEDFYGNLPVQRNLFIQMMELRAAGRPVYWLTTIWLCAPQISMPAANATAKSSTNQQGQSNKKKEKKAADGEKAVKSAKTKAQKKRSKPQNPKPESPKANVSKPKMVRDNPGASTKAKAVASIGQTNKQKTKPKIKQPLVKKKPVKATTPVPSPPMKSKPDNGTSSSISSKKKRRTSEMSPPTGEAASKAASNVLNLRPKKKAKKGKAQEQCPKLQVKLKQK